MDILRQAQAQGSLFRPANMVNFIMAVAEAGCGYDGDNPANPKLSGADIVSTNTQGFDISSTSVCMWVGCMEDSINNI